MADLFTVVDDAIVIDRSTLERFSDCPRSAAFTRDQGEPESRAMVSGSSAHDAISQTIREYIEMGGDMNPTEIAHTLTTNLRAVRADLQPDVLEAVPDWMRWSIGRMLAEHHAGDILRFDGGTGEQSGQLARDVEIGREVVRVTSELDLLMATRSPDVLAEHDWKTGWKEWTAADVLSSFQFCLHWWIVAEVYPDAQHLDVTIWNTRRGSRSDRVRFTRRDLGDINARVLSAVGDWMQSRDQAPAHCEARPYAEKCSLCPFSIDCMDAAIVENEAPEAMVDRLVVLSAACDELKSRLWTERDKRQADIVTASGNCFGWDKPKSKPRKPADPLYQRSE